MFVDKLDLLALLLLDARESSGDLAEYRVVMTSHGASWPNLQSF